MIPDPTLAVLVEFCSATVGSVAADPTWVGTLLQETTTARETTTSPGGSTPTPNGSGGTTSPDLGATNGSSRLLPTVGVVVVLAVATALVKYAGRRLRGGDRFDATRIDTVEATTTTGLIVVAAAVVLFLWHDVTPVEMAIERFRPDPLFGIQVVATLLVLAGAYGLAQVAGRVLKRRDPGDGHRPPSVDHRREVAFYVTEVGVYVVAGLLVLTLWRVNLGNLLIGAGFLGIVVGLAARQTLGAVIAGFVLLFARHFEVGEWVVIGDREGVVTDVNVVHTRLRTFDGEQVVIPNDRVANRDVINRSREGRLRVTQEVGIDYATEVGRAVEVAREAIEDCEVGPLLSAPGPDVVAKRFDDSSVVLELRFWISTPTARRMWRTRTAVTEAVKEAFEREGIAIPFPQRTVSGRGGGRGDARGPAPEGIPPSVDPGEAASVSVARGSGDGDDGEGNGQGSGDGVPSGGSGGTEESGSGHPGEADGRGSGRPDATDDPGSGGGG